MKPKKPRTATIKVSDEVDAQVEAILATIQRTGTDSLAMVWARYLEDQPLTKGSIVKAAVAAMHTQFVFPKPKDGR